MRVHLISMHLISVYFIGVHLISVHLIGVHLIDVYLMSVHLAGVYLMGVYFMDVHLMGVCLMGIHLTGMHLIAVYIMGVHLMARTLRSRSVCRQRAVSLLEQLLHSVLFSTRSWMMQRNRGGVSVTNWMPLGEGCVRPIQNSALRSTALVLDGPTTKPCAGRDQLLSSSRMSESVVGNAALHKYIHCVERQSFTIRD
jgi:hypothetical protein